MTGPVWCLTCLRFAEPYGPDMDARHPLVFCPDRPNGTRTFRGCGRVVGSIDPAEVERIRADREAVKAGREHAVHVRDGLARRDCEACRPAVAHGEHRTRRLIHPTCHLCATAAARAAIGPHA